MSKFRSLFLILLLSILIVLISGFPAFSKEKTSGKYKTEGIKTDKKQTDKSGKVKLDEVLVTAPRGKQGVLVTPSMTTINVKEYKMPGTSQNVLDVIKDQAIIDFRGQSDLVPGYDTIYMRGFDASRFTMAMDGMTIDYGGEAGFNVVNYGTLPIGQIESIEIMPGPHSALYGGKSEGGVINLKTKIPERYTTSKPDIKVSTSYKSYNTQNHSIDANGGINSFFYDLSYQYYHTDGYLRNNEAEINNYFTKFGYILPSDGYISLDIAYSDIYREQVVRNQKEREDYDSSYPETTTSSYGAWQKPNINEDQYTYRLNYEQPHPYGTFTLGAYYRDQDTLSSYWLDKSTNSSRGASIVNPGDIYYYDWGPYPIRQAGGRIQDEFKISDNHTLTFGFDVTHMWQPDDLITPEAIKKSRDIATLQGYYLQDKWTIFPRLTLTAGLRYEDVTFKRCNVNWGKDTHYITGKGDWIERDEDQIVPKSFLTYELDDLSDILRDTTISAGVSKIWNPMPFCYGCGRQVPTTAWAEPEHGIGYDFIFTRRLWKDINLKINYSFYIIKDYVASNRGYQKYDPNTNDSVPPGFEYSDIYVNLEEMQYQGLEFGLNGHITDNLSFYINYVYTDLNSQGDEPAGKLAEAERAEHRVNAGLRYHVFKNTLLMLDYKFQDEQIQQSSEEVGPDEYVWYTVDMDKYHLFDFAIEQTLFQEYGCFKDVVAKFYINNLVDEEYTNSRGYPMTDRTYGCSISFQF